MNKSIDRIINVGSGAVDGLSHRKKGQNNLYKLERNSLMQMITVMER